MNGPCATALKEWAAICAALDSGRQSILLRKGGLIERSGTFEVEHSLFWLYPTYLHQQEQGVVNADRDFLEQAREQQPAAGQVRLSLCAKVAAAWQITEESLLPGLDSFHAWTPETIRARFHYRTPGLTLLLLRVYREESFLITETAEQSGCRSWVPLGSPRAPSFQHPTLDDSTWELLESTVISAMTDRIGAIRLSLV